MKTLHFYTGCLLFVAVVVEIVQPTCVLESDFGFKINCAFKKSGLFRVRNLGGLKAHASIGFSLGDELGFEQSLTNLDPSRRRSVSLKNGVPPNLITETGRATGKQEKRGKQNRIMMRPPAPSTRLNPSAMEKLSTLHRRASSTMQPIVVSNPTQELPTFAKVNPTPQITMAKPLPMGVPPFKPLPPKEEKLNVLPISSPTRKIYTPLQIPQSKGPSLAYQSEHYNHNTVSQDHITKMVAQMTASHMMPHLYRITPQPIVVQNTPSYRTTVHPFIPMPIESPSAAISIIPAPVFKNSVQIPLAPSMLSNTPLAFALTQNTMSIHKPDPPISNFVDPVPHHVHQLATQLQPIYSSNTKKADDYNTISGYGDDTTLKFSKDDINEKIAEIAKAGNISMEAVEAAIALRQQQLLNKYANIQVPVPTTTTSTTTSTTTTQAPRVFQPQPEPEIVVQQVHHKPKRNNPTSGKVMNAPREYYPVGYEKNFDDQFQSKVDLPDTNFHCGDQKYFPGLYGDENLGCMVFHVCALTDDGLVMKSFLCPESTLFDQTILKCNWWFYVDCKSTRKLYDTNIPVSKSYQLMKALTFFSSYNKETGGDANRQTANPEDIAGIKEAITILENQDTMKQQSAPGLQIVTPQPLSQTGRNSHQSNTTEEQPSPVYRINRNNRNVTRNTDREKTKKSNSQEDQRTSNSELKLVTVNADMNYSTENSTKVTSSQSSKERQLRRNQTLRAQSSTAKPKTTTTASTTTTSTTNRPETTSAVEIIKQEMQPLEYFNINDAKTNEQPLDHIDLEPSVIRETENLPTVKRFYRSSSETNSKELKEIAMVKDEKVQIVRPTSRARLVGQFATPSAAIEKLDEAILGKSNARFKKEASLTIVTPERNLSPKNRERT